MQARDSLKPHLNCVARGTLGEADMSDDGDPLPPQAGANRVDRVPAGVLPGTSGASMRTSRLACAEYGVQTQI